MEFGDEGLSLARLTRAVDAARECGLAAVSANDHFLFGTPWLDGPTALAAVVERSGSMELATTVALVSLRGPVQLAKAIAALDVLSEGRVIAGVGPGSSERDYEATGVPYDDRWGRFEDSVKRLRELLGPDSPLSPAPARAGGVPIWLGSWGSGAGMRRVRRLGDGWFASSYNTTPEAFAAARESLPAGFPNALVTMWTWITPSAAGRRPRPPRRPRTAASPRSGHAARPALRRVTAAMRGTALPLRGGRLRARSPLAAGRRAAADRAGGRLDRQVNTCLLCERWVTYSRPSRIPPGGRSSTS